jgi:hypothetical protein
MRFDATIDAFVEALTDLLRPAPPETRGREGRPDARRFAVYRNNIAVGLIASLEMRYPVTRRLVGDDFFRAMAQAFVARNKPSSPVLILYGAEFPAFVETFEPAREIAYLPDVARLENAWVESYHSADAMPLELSDIAARSVSSFIRPSDCCTLPIPPPRSGPRIRARANRMRPSAGALRTR